MKGEQVKVKVKKERGRVMVKEEQGKMRMCSDLRGTTMWHRLLKGASWRATLG